MSARGATATEARVPQEPNAPGRPAPGGLIPVAVPEIRGREWSYLKECLETNWVSSAGPFVDRLESMLAERIGVGYAVATASGTAALHTALLLAGVEPDDEVLVSTFTFIAPANAIRYCGAWPVFVDAEPHTWQMDPELLVDFIEKDCRPAGGRLVNRHTSRTVRAVLPVHVLGHPCDMDPIRRIAERYELGLIEDAAESLGASYRQQPVGSFGDLACFSFNGNKLITAGGGGMLVTDDAAQARLARHITTQAKLPGGEFTHDRVGYNYRLTNIQAAVGCAQLEQLDAFVAAKRAIAKTYAEVLSDLPGITPMPEADWATSTHWLYTLLVDERRFGIDSRELIERLRAAGICSQPRWQPLHQTGAHRGSQALLRGVAERLYRQAISLPCSVGLDLATVRWIAERIRSSAAG